MTHSSAYTVSVELKRVQTYIFEVPKLKAMLGANATIGRILRRDLTQLAVALGAMPASARAVPAGDAHDPLQPDDALDRDDPAALYARGILVRDGGRFKAIFRDDTQAEAFRRAGENLIAEKLPGVLFDAKTEPLRRSADDGAINVAARRPSHAAEAFVIDLPLLQVCQATGHEPASRRLPNDQGTWAALSVHQRLAAGEKTSLKSSKDIVGLMRGPLGLDGRSWREPEDLEDLVRGGYLALIHADGNGVGRRYKEWALQRDADDDSTAIEREAHGERFYHSMRVAVRQALVAAIPRAFGPPDGNFRPYSVLMLGGDDLLVACRADCALGFAKAYAEELTKHPLADQKGPLAVAIGIAIAAYSYPLHRLHELAEALASSAKRLHRAAPGLGSVVDWQVVTESWFDDLAESRRRTELRHYSVEGNSETIALSSRPYPVLAERGLAGLLDSVYQLDTLRTDKSPHGAPRSPLRALRSAFETGRNAAEAAFSGLDEPIRQALSGGDGTSPWQTLTEDFYLTRVLDVVGIREIRHLGSSNRD